MKYKHLPKLLSNSQSSVQVKRPAVLPESTICMSFRTESKGPSLIQSKSCRFNLVDSRYLGVACLALLSLIFSQDTAHAQALRAQISVISLAPARVKVEGRLDQGAQRAWSFLNSYAGLMGLAERIENLKLAERDGTSVPVRKLATGEYEAAKEASEFSYEVKLDAPLNANDAAHVSWLAATRGFLMLGDLLPQTYNGKALKSGSVRFILPMRWTIAANESRDADGAYLLADAQSAVFFVGQDLRERRQRAGSLQLSFVSAGEWAFTDEDAANLAAEIIKDYTETFGGSPLSQATFFLAPFPGPAGADRWSAETRGGTITLLSGRSASKLAALAQLSVPLTHELFHFWIPNGLSLTGDYDWFYEGFTTYQAMRAGMRLNYLTFQDYLNALARAFDTYSAVQGRDELSLTEASRRRWSSPAQLVYQKAMLVAFLYDLQLRMQTSGKSSLDDVYRELFRRHHQPEKKMDGNTAVIAALGAPRGMEAFAPKYIERPVAIDLVQALAPFGLRVEKGARTHISVADSLNRSQRDLLRKFGYNDKVRSAVR